MQAWIEQRFVGRKKLGQMTPRELNEFAHRIGCTTDEAGSSSGLQSKPILIQRILEMQRTRREELLWVLAFVSAIGSGVSALAAWAAVGAQ